jgi:hypothetical protein
VLTGEDLAMLRECSCAYIRPVISERCQNAAAQRKSLSLYFPTVAALTPILLVLSGWWSSMSTRPSHDQQYRYYHNAADRNRATLLRGCRVIILLLSRYFGSAVKELAMQLQAILDNSPALIYVKDRDWDAISSLTRPGVSSFRSANSNVKGKDRP